MSDMFLSVYQDDDNSTTLCMRIAKFEKKIHRNTNNKKKPKNSTCAVALNIWRKRDFYEKVLTCFA